MWVTRTLYPAHGRSLRAAYVELVATATGAQRRGHATQLMQRLAHEIRAWDIGALSPALLPFYERLGWESWRGPPLVRRSHGVEPTPDDAVMILRLPSAPAWLNLDDSLSVDWRPGETW
jgi:aminoglycoside 2'-N-acetyltransferase I